MRLVGSGAQQRRDHLYVADGAIATGGQAQLILPETISRSYLAIQNLSAGQLTIEIGSARATCTILNGAVNSVTVTNGGFGFTVPPTITFMGGGGIDGVHANTSYLGLNQPGGLSPMRLAKGHAVLTGAPGAGVVTSIVIDDPGANYARAPYVLIENSTNDPYGCAAPTSTTGLIIAANSPTVFWNGTFCPTDPIAVLGPTTGQTFACRWSD